MSLRLELDQTLCKKKDLSEEKTIHQKNSLVYRIRFDDCDPFGHLNNARYFDYLMHGLEDYFREQLEIDFSVYFKSGFGWIVNSHEIVYLRPVGQNEEVRICIDIVKVTEYALQVEMKMFDSENHKLKAILKTNLIHFNTSKGKSVPMSTDVFFRIAKFRNLNIDAKDSIQNRITHLRITRRKSRLSA